jgi:hypothetical protein
MLYVGPLAVGAAALADAPRNTDARPRFDFLGARVREADRKEFLRSWWPAFADSLAAGAAPDAPFASRLDRARDGAALVRASALRLDRRELESQSEIARLRSRVPPELLNRPDPSVSELWMSR